MGEYESTLRLMKGAIPDHEAARRLLDDASAEGDPRACYAPATWYLHGTHVKKSLRKGAHLLRVAADHKIRNALFDLAVLHERGRGVAKDKEIAFGLFRDAAERGDPQAMTEVGRMLYYGIGVTKDREAADRWLSRAEHEDAAARDAKRPLEIAV